MARKPKQIILKPQPHMPKEYNVSIHLTDNEDPNGPNNFNYAPGFLQVHHGDKVTFKCNRPFTVKFVYGTPFGDVSVFSKGILASTADNGTIDPGADLQVYHYTVSATDANGIIHMDGGCPSLDVI
jgi:hypothetical protein